MYYCPHREGQRRQLHGGQGALALPIAGRPRGRSGDRRAGARRIGARSMRTAFFTALLEAAGDDPRINLVTADLGFGVVEPFAKRFPDRFLNVGVAEQNMTGIAAGLAMSGKTVFTYSIANFPTLRCLEQIRNDVCYHRADVKVVTVGGGFSYGALGMTHHATEDLAIMRALPEMTVIAPGDPIETVHATRAIASTPGPVYLRLGRAGEAAIHTGPLEFQLG